MEFLVSSEEALFSYQWTKNCEQGNEFTLAYDDPTLNIPRPLKDVKLSEKDKLGFNLDESIKR